MSHIIKIVLIWNVLQSLQSISTPSWAQLPIQDRTLQATIYAAHENPFLIYVRLDNPQRRMVSISVFTENNKILFTNWTTKYKYNIKLNLFDLPNGEFWVQVTDQRKVIKKEFAIHTLYEQKTQRIVSLSDWTGH